MLNDTQVNTLADHIIASLDLQAWLGAFHWNQKALPEAWTERQALALSGDADSAEHYSDLVHRWGFGGQAVRKVVRENVAFIPALQTLCRTWSGNPRPWECAEAMEALIARLDIEYLGIARVSKFVCFLDQDRYAIYDSRVSYALKDLTLDGVHRVFPFVAGKQVAADRYVLADLVTGTPRRIATSYVDFLRLMRRIVDKLNAVAGITDPSLHPSVGRKWSPALLEMALFMAGQKRDRNPGIRKLDASLAAVWPEVDFFQTCPQ